MVIVPHQKSKTVPNHPIGNELLITNLSNMINDDPDQRCTVGNSRIKWIFGKFWKQYSSRNFLEFFPMISCRKAQEIDWNPPEKIQQISGQNTASTSGYSRCFPAGSSDRNLQLGKK
jgi:hypothetical protein